MQFNGFACDLCGKVIRPEERTRKTVRFEGPAAEGDFTQDLCEDCVVMPDGITLRPIRRRKRRGDGVRDQAPTAPVESVVAAST